MPKYEFKCLACGTTGEETRAVEKRDAPAKCPKCGGPMHRVFGGIGGIHVVDGTRGGYA